MGFGDLADACRELDSLPLEADDFAPQLERVRAAKAAALEGIAHLLSDRGLRLATPAAA